MAERETHLFGLEELPRNLDRHEIVRRGCGVESPLGLRLSEQRKRGMATVYGCPFDPFVPPLGVWRCGCFS